MLQAIVESAPPTQETPTGRTLTGTPRLAAVAHRLRMQGACMSAYVVCTRACVYVPLCRWDEYRACSSPRVSSVTRLLWHLRLLLLLALDVVAVILCVRWEHRAAVETIWVNNHMAHYVGLATDLVGNTSASSASSSCTWPLLAAGGHRVSPTDDGATILLASFDFVFVTEVLDLSMDACLLYTSPSPRDRG